MEVWKAKLPICFHYIVATNCGMRLLDELMGLNWVINKLGMWKGMMENSLHIMKIAKLHFPKFCQIFWELMGKWIYIWVLGFRAKGRLRGKKFSSTLVMTTGNYNNYTAAHYHLWAYLTYMIGPWIAPREFGGKIRICPFSCQKNLLGTLITPVAAHVLIKCKCIGLYIL